MDPFLDSRSLSTTASSSVPHTPSPPMSSVEDPAASAASNLGYESGSAQYYLDYQTQQPHQLQPGAQPQHPHQQHQPPIHLVDSSQHSPQTSSAGSLYRRASFPFVHHDHSLSSYGKYPEPAPPVPELPAVAAMPQHVPLHMQEHHHYEYDDGLKMEPSSTAPMVVPTQIPPGPHHIGPGFYRPSSASSSVSSVSATPSYLNPVMSNIPVLHTDDAASKETQYLRRKCFNCGTTEPPSWRRSTLNPGKIVCNKCGLYERTHNKPRPHQFGLRPGNKTRKQSLPTLPSHSMTGKVNGTSPSTSPKRHGLSIKKEPLDYRQAMRRGSIASINSGSGTSDWDDHSGYSTASSAYPPSLGMVPPPPLPPHSQQQQQHSASHHHVPSHHGHHPYNSALSMPPPRSMSSSSIRLPQAPPMKIPGRVVGPSSPLTSANLVPGIPTANATGNGGLAGSPEGMLASPVVSSTPPQQHLLPTSSYGLPTLTQIPAAYATNAPPMLPSTDYYARRGSTSQIPPHHVNHYHQDVMRRGSVGAFAMAMTASSPSTAYGPGVQHRHTHLPPPTWEHHTPYPLETTESVHQISPVQSHGADRSLTPTSLVGANFGGPSVGEVHSASSTPRRDLGTVGEYTPSPPQGYIFHPHGASTSSSSSPVIQQNVTPELATLAA
ncbi:hypothetical protein FRC17_004375 [Serendipita sp. 399]|nr:hypothetical protein FRC17_004375 [Serendipita sp. 399]